MFYKKEKAMTVTLSQQEMDEASAFYERTKTVIQDNFALDQPIESHGLATLKKGQPVVIVGGYEIPVTLGSLLKFASHFGMFPIHHPEELERLWELEKDLMVTHCVGLIMECAQKCRLVEYSSDCSPSEEWVNRYGWAINALAYFAEAERKVNAYREHQSKLREVASMIEANPEWVSGLAEAKKLQRPVLLSSHTNQGSMMTTTFCHFALPNGYFHVADTGPVYNWVDSSRVYNLPEGYTMANLAAEISKLREM